MDDSLKTLALDPTRQTLPTLSFCVPEPERMAAWTDTLPIANHPETARQLYQAVSDLNHLVCTASVRFSLLEVIRPITLQICEALMKNFLRKGVTLNEQQRKVANITQAIYLQLTQAYRLCVQQYLHDKASSDKKHFVESIYRALQSGSYSLLCSHQLYVSAPEGFWLQTNELFALAEHHHLCDKVIALDDTQHGGLQTIRAIYAATLLFHTSKPAQLRQAEQILVYRALANWTGFVTLHSPAKSEDLFVVRLDRNMPPIYQSFYSEAKDAESAGLDLSALIKGFNASMLVDNLKNSRIGLNRNTEKNSGDLQIPKEIDHALVTHLIHTWGIMAIRTSERKSIQGSVDICVGLTAVHYYLSGCVDFDLQMQMGQHSALAGGENNPFAAKEPSSNERHDDDWESTHKIPENPLYDADIKDLMKEADGSVTSALTESEAYPTLSVAVVNISATGCCLGLKTLPPQLQTGEIIGIRSKSGWRTGAIRWVRHIKNEGTQIGIEFLGQHVTPCGARLLHKSGDTSAYMRTLLVRTQQLDTLITPRIPFKEGSKAYIKNGESERRVILSPLLAATGGFCQFKFSYINELPKND